jgi:hypothetical protein
MAERIQDVSKRHLSFEKPISSPNYDLLQTSCMMRIADSVDIISQEYLKILKKVAYYEEQHALLHKENKFLKVKISSLKGQLTKAKNKMT